MNLSGRVHNGVIVLDGGATLPEGAVVVVSYPPMGELRKSDVKRRVEFPLVRSTKPGSVHLTGERIAEILNEEDVPAGHQLLAGPDV
jgi:hypothetical protein